MTKKTMSKILFTLFFMVGCYASIEEGTKKWQEDLSKEMKIGLATGGYSQVVLECSDDWMAFVVTLDKDFNGVIYTRGSFHLKETHCFLDANGGHDFALKIPYEACNSKHDSTLGGFTTTVVVQHDKDLITPGDLGFTLLCKDEKSVSASLEGMRSRISLVEADPSVKTSNEAALSAMSPSNIVTLTPPKVDLKSPKREEL